MTCISKNDKWEYGEVYKKYDMDGDIHIGSGIVRVHDIFEPLPGFMKNADVIFSDPPCSEGNLKSFYTKAGMLKKHFYDMFQDRFFECIDEIKPKVLFIEVFASNMERFFDECKKRYPEVCIIESRYYNNRKNKCWILYASHRIDQKLVEILSDKDEQKIIELICKHHSFECIGDLCMGRGLVGMYANKYGKKFVGTELNKKRLAVLLDRINGE